MCLIYKEEAGEISGNQRADMVPVLSAVLLLACSASVMRAERSGVDRTNLTVAWTLGSMDLGGMEPGANCP